MLMYLFFLDDNLRERTMVKTVHAVLNLCIYKQQHNLLSKSHLMLVCVNWEHFQGIKFLLLKL